MKKRLALQSVRIKNFKAIQDSGEIKLTPLTVLIGSNGSGKSSLIEALETYQSIIATDLNGAFQRWRGFTYVLNQAVPHTPQEPRRLTPTITESSGGKGLRVRTHEQGSQAYLANPLEFQLGGSGDRCRYLVGMDIAVAPGNELIFIQRERVYLDSRKILHRNDDGAVYKAGAEPKQPWSLQYQLPAGESLISPFRRDNAEIKPIADSILGWQFAALNPLDMGSPRPRRMTGGVIQLQRDGSNLAEYLLDIYQKDTLAFNGIVETLQ